MAPFDPVKLVTCAARTVAATGWQVLLIRCWCRADRSWSRKSPNGMTGIRAMLTHNTIPMPILLLRLAGDRGLDMPEFHVELLMRDTISPGRKSHPLQTIATCGNGLKAASEPVRAPCTRRENEFLKTPAFSAVKDIQPSGWHCYSSLDTLTRFRILSMP